jgi:hypothetical protein
MFWLFGKNSMFFGSFQHFGFFVWVRVWCKIMIFWKLSFPKMRNFISRISEILNFSGRVPKDIPEFLVSPLTFFSGERKRKKETCQPSLQRPEWVSSLPLVPIPAKNLREKKN